MSFESVGDCVAQVNHNCIICGTGYMACDDCGKVKSWRAICDTAQHYQIYMLVLDIKANRVSKNDANAQLECIGVNRDEINAFKPSVKKLLLDILDINQTVEDDKISIQEHDPTEVILPINLGNSNTALGRKRKKKNVEG